MKGEQRGGVAAQHGKGRGRKGKLPRIASQQIPAAGQHGEVHADNQHAQPIGRADNQGQQGQHGQRDQRQTHFLAQLAAQKIGMLLCGHVHTSRARSPNNP
ncbi:hypothetical protein D3C72_1910930 [compost metagenome]